MSSYSYQERRGRRSPAVRSRPYALPGLVLLLCGELLLLLTLFTPNMRPAPLAGLPTAHVFGALQANVTLAELPPGLATALPTGTSLAPTLTAGVAGAFAPTLVPIPSALPQATLTNTPVALPEVAAPITRPPATLMPTLVPESAPPAPAVAPAGGPIPILMYHYIRDVDQNADPLGYALSISPASFAQQLDWLASNGYTTVRMDQLAGCLRGQEGCPAGAIALTFDDGYDDAYHIVLPALKERGFTATFYIVSGFIGSPGYMGWPELEALHDAGMELGAHSVDHLDLTTLDPGEATRQITQSKTDLEQQLGISVSSFCYPSGRYSPATESQASAAGYSNATTTRWDDNVSDLFALPRRRISGGTDLERFAVIVRGY